MLENILIAILGGGNLVMFAKFLIERHDKKVEKQEEKEEEAKRKEEENELTCIKDALSKVKKDGIRTQLLLLILMSPDEEQEILTVAEYYFVRLKANWYMTSIFKKWCDERKLEPDWFDDKE